MANEQEIFAAFPDDRWRLVTDGVMGGVSRGNLREQQIDGIPCQSLTGRVSTDNNGGFVQMTLELDGRVPAATEFDGLRVRVRGNGEAYNVHLRTADLWLPWQSYRVTFTTTGQWQTLYLPFSAFEPHRIRKPLDVRRLRRVGFVAIGRDFDADLCVAEAGFYRRID
jgi:hypothetical protein